MRSRCSLPDRFARRQGQKGYKHKEDGSHGLALHPTARLEARWPLAGYRASGTLLSEAVFRQHALKALWTAIQYYNPSERLRTMPGESYRRTFNLEAPS